MDREKTHKLFEQGQDVWNAWADAMLRRRAAMAEDGTWNANKAAWEDQAKADFSGYPAKHTFSNDADFRKYIFPGDAAFDGVTFAGDATFESAMFKGIAGFKGAAFAGNANFGGATFAGSVRFDSAKFARDAGFFQASFAGDVQFLNATFEGFTAFHRVTITGAARFEFATFKGSSEFNDALFAGNVRFINATFGGAADVMEIGSDAEFKGATFTRDADFSGAEFRGEAGFGQAAFKGKANFVSVIFVCDAKFSDATFKDDAGFLYSIFKRDSGFNGARFAGDADFSSATFTGSSRFGHAMFVGKAVFTRAIFMRNAGFDGATFASTAEFTAATFTGDTGFKGATFAGNAGFMRAAFNATTGRESSGTNTNFERVRFTSDVQFSTAHFFGPVDFSGAVFRGEPDFSSIRSDVAFILSGADFVRPPNLLQSVMHREPRLDNISVGGFRGWLAWIPVLTPPLNWRDWTTETELFGFQFRRPQIPLIADTDGPAKYRELKGYASKADDTASELLFHAGEIRTSRFVNDLPWHWRFWFGLLYGLFSLHGRSIVRPFLFWAAGILLSAMLYLSAQPDAENNLIRDPSAGWVESARRRINEGYGRLFEGLGCYVPPEIAEREVREHTILVWQPVREQTHRLARTRRMWLEVSDAMRKARGEAAAPPTEPPPLAELPKLSAQYVTGLAPKVRSQTAAHWEAIQIAFRNALFVLDTSSDAAHRSYGCLYGVERYGDNPVAIVPPFASTVGGWQKMWSFLMIFLFGLGLRNMLKIK